MTDFLMTDDEIKTLLTDIQKAIDNRDIEAALSYYHTDIVYIGAASPKPIEGQEALRTAFVENFKGPQKTAIKFGKVGVTRISEQVFAVYCQVDGRQTIYFSTREFKGWLSRIFVMIENRPMIIHEHFTIIT